MPKRHLLPPLAGGGHRIPATGATVLLPPRLAVRLDRAGDRLAALWRDGFGPRAPAAYLFAVACVTIASVLRYGLIWADWVDDDQLPFAVYYPAILIVTLLGGLGPGSFAAAFSLILIGSDSVPHFAWPGRAQTIFLAVHVAASALTVWLANGYRHNIRRLREEEKQRAFLMRELQHRSRNLLAVVQSIVNMTLRGNAADAERINRAIAALMTADELLTRSAEHTADLKEILAAELRPYAATRVAVTGESVMLDPSRSRVMALVLHELATNAAKHGALSRPEGRLAVSWAIEADRIRIRWVEEGGPTLVAPVRRGFGSHLMERLFNGVHGTVMTEFRPGGLHCEMSFSYP